MNETEIMSKETETLARAEPIAGASGSLGHPSDNAEAVRNAAMLSVATLKKIGNGLNGFHWQSDVARDLQVSKAQMTRWLNGERRIPVTLPKGLQLLILRRIVTLIDLLTTPGLPNDDEMRAETKALKTAASTLLEKRKSR